MKRMTEKYRLIMQRELLSKKVISCPYDEGIKINEKLKEIDEKIKKIKFKEMMKTKIALGKNEE